MNKRILLLITATVLLLGSTQMASAQSTSSSKGSDASAAAPIRPTFDIINFEGIPTGTIVDSVFGRLGSGPISVQGANPDLPGENVALIFNSNRPTGEDPDLGTPNEDFGGPGIGAAGEAGSPFQNDRRLRKILIIAEDLVDDDGDGRVDDPDDADTLGSALMLDFLDLAPVTVESLDLLDVEADRPAASVEFFDESGASLGTVDLPIVGDNGLANVDLGSVSGVQRMRITLNGSGAIDNVFFRRENLAELGDFVWCDLDNDGVQDPGEPGIPGVSVDLVCAGPDGVLGTGDDIVPERQVTDEDGFYLFTDLPAGACEATVDVNTAPPGKVPGMCPTTVATDLGLGESFLDADFCFISTGEIGDFVWCDLDNDGVQDPGEPGIEGVTVSLRCAGPDGILGNGDDLLDSTATDADGSYLFTDLPAGICKVEVDPSTAPDGKVPGDGCPLSFTVDLGAGESYLDADFCFITPGEIGDFVWCDTDLDGEQDAGEPGIEGVVVDLVCAGLDGLIGTADDYTDTTVTDANGFYLFSSVAPGLCEVTVDVTTVDGKVPGDDCPTTVTKVLESDESCLDVDFCFNFPPGEIGDFVYCDLDRDGEQDGGEPGIEGVIIELTCAGIDGLLGTADDYTDLALTDANGMYLFTDVPAGLCEVAVDLNSGPDDKVPGQCPPIVMVDLQPDQSFLDADFCFEFPPPGEIGDFVWCDLDDDGVQDPREPGIEGVTVDLVCAGPDGILGTADDYTDSMVTDVNGNYLFTDIPPGECEVTVDVSTAPEDKVPGTNCPTLVAVDLQSDQSFLDADFCFIFPPGEIGDTVYCDLDNDGVQDPGEPGIDGAVVNLLCAGPDGAFGTADDITDSQMTDANGNYLFVDVPAGVCQVSVDVDSVGDKLPGECPLEFEVDLQPAQSFLDADFCFVSPGTIGDTVFCDLDGDGFQDPGEPGIQDVAVSLVCAGDDGVIGTADDFEASDVTDGLGNYLFTGVPPGLCQVTVDVNSVPPPKVPGNCPIELTIVLDPGQTFLDADFCFEFPPPTSCCENGKPRSLTFLYTGEDCSATSHAQDPGKVNCAGDPGFAATVHIRATDKENPDDGGARIWFEGDVNLDQAYTLEAANAGETKLENATFIHIFDLGDNLLQSVEFHTSCSQPLATFDQFGANLLIDCEGEDEPIEGDCCANGKPRELTFTYTGEDCSATTHAQDPSKVTCAGDPGFASTVFIRGTEKENPSDTSGKIWFEGDVDLGANYTLDATSAGENRLTNATFIHIFDLAGNLLQSVEFHTSCSQPLFVGNQFGANLLVDCVGENEPGDPGSADSCDDGKPQVLIMRYTGEDCGATNNGQDPDKVNCDGDPNFEATVFIRASDKENPDDTGGNNWFEGNVVLEGQFDIDATRAGETRLKTATFVHVFDLGGNLLQTIEFHTSCSQPLSIGDQFGSAVLDVFIPE